MLAQVLVLTREGRFGQEGKAQEEEELLWLAVVVRGEGLSRDVVVVVVVVVAVVAVVEGGRGAEVGERSMDELVEAKVKLEPKLFSILAVGWLGEAFSEKGSNGDMVSGIGVEMSVENVEEEKARKKRRKRVVLIAECNPRKQTTKNASPESHPRKLTSPPFLWETSPNLCR